MTWTLPPLSLLEPAHGADTVIASPNPETVSDALTNAGVAVEDVAVHVAPQLHRYLVKLAPGADPKKVERAIGTVELAVGAPVRYAGAHEGHVIIEQNRALSDVVNLRDVIERSEALVRLGIPLGVAATGGPLTARLADMPHLLVAGATGAGKSAFLTSTLVSLLMRNTPADLRLTLIDPKRVELAAFADVPHVNETVTEVTHAGPVLRRLVDTMESRYRAFEEAGVRSIEEFNDKVDDGERLARQVLVVDELADLILNTKVCEQFLIRLATLGRAAGIHLILATQHPEAKVLTGQLRLNVPARVVFAVQSHVASNVALGYSGAEKLRGSGDGLFKAPAIGDPLRFQAPLVGRPDVLRVVGYWVREGQAQPGAFRVEGPSPQPVDEPVDDGAALRAEADAWLEEQVDDGAVASLSAEEILSDLGFTPLAIDALAEVISDKIAARVVENITSVLPSVLPTNPVDTTEGDESR